MLIIFTFDIKWWKWHLTFVIFLLLIQNFSLIMRNYPAKTQEEHSANTWPIILRSVKAIKSKESLRNGQSSGDVSIKCHGWDPGTGKGHSVQFSRSVMSDSLRPRESQHTRPPCPSPTPGVHPNSSSWWCHPAISSSVVPFSSCPQSLPASWSFPKSQLFAWGGQSIRFSVSPSVLPKNTQDWAPLGWTGWISLQSKGLSRVFSNTTVQKHQFFGAQLSSQSNSHIHTWPLENT